MLLKYSSGQYHKTLQIFNLQKTGWLYSKASVFVQSIESDEEDKDTSLLRNLPIFCRLQIRNGL